MNKGRQKLWDTEGEIEREKPTAMYFIEKLLSRILSDSIICLTVRGAVLFYMHICCCWWFACSLMLNATRASHIHMCCLALAKAIIHTCSIQHSVCAFFCIMFIHIVRSFVRSHVRSFVFWFDCAYYRLSLSLSLSPTFSPSRAYAIVSTCSTKHELNYRDEKYGITTRLAYIQRTYTDFAKPHYCQFERFETIYSFLSGCFQHFCCRLFCFVLFFTLILLFLSAAIALIVYISCII